MENECLVNGVAYKILKLLGHGKGGYSYMEESFNGAARILEQCF